MATLAADIANDYRDFDGLQSVTLQQVRPGGTNQVTIEYEDSAGDDQPAALRRQLSRRDVQALGLGPLTGAETVWELPVSIVGSAGVETGDRIVEEVATDGSQTIWRVLSADLATLGTRWRCVCVRQE